MQGAETSVGYLFIFNKATVYSTIKSSLNILIFKNSCLSYIKFMKEFHKLKADLITVFSWKLFHGEVF